MYMGFGMPEIPKTEAFAKSGDPSAMLPGTPTTYRIGSRQGVPGGTSTRDASRYSGTACPPGNVLVRRETQPRSPRFIGDTTSDDFVYCRPAPVAAPVMAPAPAGPVYTTTISPVMQQAFTPQISPTIQVTADSPGAQVGATTQQTAPGGQQAEGGGAGADVDAIARLLESQRAFQAELDARAKEQREHELVRAAEREAADQRERDRIDRERVAAIEDEERQRLEDERRLPAVVPAVMPGRQLLPVAAPMRPPSEIVIDRGQPVEPEAAAPDTSLIVAAIVGVLLIGGYAYSQQQRKR